MTNKEKYNDELMKILIHGGKLGVHKETGKPITCGTNLDCRNCQFCACNRFCSEEREKWLNEEYIEPQVDWSKVPVDTPILTSYDGVDWHNRYFAKAINGEVWAWSNGVTSWTTHAHSMTRWEYAKLAESEENVE